MSEILTWRSKQDSNFLKPQQTSYRQDDNREQSPTTISGSHRDSWQETVYDGQMNQMILHYVKTTHNIEIRQILSGETVPTGERWDKREHKSV